MRIKSRRRVVPLIATLTASGLLMAGCSGGSSGGSSSGAGGSEPVSLTIFSGSGVDANIKTEQALGDAFTKENPNIKIVIDASGPSDATIDNVIKTRLATGSMADMFWYNSGSLFQNLNADKTLLNIKDEAFAKNLDKSFVTTVSTANGIYGVPVQAAGAGGIFYNIPIYQKLGLSIPTTWDEFMSNNEKIKAAGYTAVEQTYGDSWTSQIVTLADFYNVYANNPNWGTEWTQNKVNFVDDPVALRSFSKLQDLHDAGFFNADFASAKLDDGLKAVATGTAASYPMLAFAATTIETNFPTQAKDVGFFAIPGDSATHNGVTSWSPSAIYAPATTPHPDAVKKFMAFIASPQGCDAITATLGVTGPYMVKGCTLPKTAPRIISDMLPYYDRGDVAPALEFLSPVKGPNLPNFTVEVGSGIADAKTAAAQYDKDAAAQAQQLGLPGW